MKRLLMPALALATIAGMAGCATYPRTPEELERQARARAEAVERGKATAAATSSIGWRSAGRASGPARDSARKT